MKTRQNPAKKASFPFLACSRGIDKAPTDGTNVPHRVGTGFFGEPVLFWGKWPEANSLRNLVLFGGLVRRLLTSGYRFSYIDVAIAIKMSMRL
jgi:hypothetical protein